jgi:hypothetical protein
MLPEERSPDDDPTPIQPRPDGANGPPDGGKGAHPKDGGSPQERKGRRCGAQLRGRPGTFCKRTPSPGSNRCRLHGGSSPIGPASATYKHGLYSKLLPRGASKRFARVMKDPELLNAAEEVGLLKMRIGELLFRLQTGETGTLWGDLQAAHAELTAAIRAGDSALFDASLRRLGEVIKNGGAVEETWEELYALIDKKTWVAAREWKRRVDMAQVITLERAIALVTAVMHSVTRHVPDVAARTRISADIKGIMLAGPEEGA